MKDERLKELMNQVGLPNSQSLYTVLLQVENETEQRIAAQTGNLTMCLADLTAPAVTINKFSEALSVFKEYIVERGTESSSLSFPTFCIQHGAER